MDLSVFLSTIGGLIVGGVLTGFIVILNIPRIVRFMEK